MFTNSSKERKILPEFKSKSNASKLGFATSKLKAYACRAADVGMSLTLLLLVSLIVSLVMDK